MRDVADTVVLISGATDGLGRGVALDLAARGATVLLHGRDAQRLEATREQVVAAGGHDRVRTYRADFASLHDVRAMADAVVAAEPQLHVLINNAGIGTGKPDLETRQTSADGYELRFAVNHLAGFLLTQRLLPLLTAGAPARIVFVASLGQAPIDFADPQIERGYSGLRAYGQSKLAQISTAVELAQRLEGTGVTTTSLHPSSLMPTKIVMEQRGHSIDTLEDGVAATVRLAIDPGVEASSGQFFDRQRPARADDQAYDADARARLWALSEQLTG